MEQLRAVCIHVQVDDDVSSNMVWGREVSHSMFGLKETFDSDVLTAFAVVRSIDSAAESSLESSVTLSHALERKWHVAQVSRLMRAAIATNFGSMTTVTLPYCSNPSIVVPRSEVGMAELRVYDQYSARLTSTVSPYCRRTLQVVGARQSRGVSRAVLAEEGVH